MPGASSRPGLRARKKTRRCRPRAAAENRLIGREGRFRCSIGFELTISPMHFGRAIIGTAMTHIGAHKQSVDVHVQIVDNQVPPLDTRRRTTYGFHLPAAMERRACLLEFTWRIDSRNADGSSLHLSANRSGVASLCTRLGATVLELDSHATESVVRTP